RTQEIELGDVLEVMQKMSSAQAASAPSVELAAVPVPTPVPVMAPVVTQANVTQANSAPAIAEAPAVVLAAPLNPNATMEIRPGDVLEEVLVDEPAAASVVLAAPIPTPENSGSDLLKTQLRPPSPPSAIHASASASIPLPQFNPDEEVAPFASDTVDIPIDRIQGLPIWLQIKGKPGVAILGGAIGACALIGALAIGMHFHNAHSEVAAAQTTRASATTITTNATMNHDDPSNAIPPPPAEPDVPSVSIDDLKAEGRSSSSDAPVSHSSHHTHAAAHHDSSFAPASHSHANSAAAKPQGFGMLRTWIAARGEPIAVDGKVVGTAPTPVKVACGNHTVAIGKEVVHANIPCDGSITVGSPDHKK
ncbi:MAG: hypothetical protein ABI461_08000, partial [Polyangiaceae bacterium]